MSPFFLLEGYEKIKISNKKVITMSPFFYRTDKQTDKQTDIRTSKFSVLSDFLAANNDEISIVNCVLYFPRHFWLT